MKRILIALVLTIPGAAFADAPAQAIQNALAQGQAALTDKSTATRNADLCSLVSSDLDNSAIGPQLLGGDAQSDDQAGVNMFYGDMPSLMVTKLVANVSKAADANIVVDDNSTDNGDGTFSVGVTVTYSGSTYNGTAIVQQNGSSYQLIDATYMGFSAVTYLGNQIQQQISGYTDSTPVTDWVNAQTSDASYIQCQ